MGIPDQQTGKPHVDPAPPPGGPSAKRWRQTLINKLIPALTTTGAAMCSALLSTELQTRNT